MAIFSVARKSFEDDSVVKYVVDRSDGSSGTLVFDKDSERIFPEHDEESREFSGVARKLAVEYLRTGVAPEAINYFA